MAPRSDRGPQLGLTFVAGDPVHAQLAEVAVRHGIKPTRIMRELIRDYLDEWVKDQLAHRRELKRRATVRKRS